MFQNIDSLEKEEDFSLVQTMISLIYEKTFEESRHPYIVVCGKLENIKSVYVVINDYRYKVDCTPEGVSELCVAFDILYKAVKVFLNSSNGSYRMYKHIIQFFDYKIFKIDCENVYQSVLKFVKNLN